jgi:hypothetical protein
VGVRRILDDGDMLAAAPAVTELADRLGAVLEEARLEVGIAPGMRHDMRAVARPDLHLIGLDDRVERGGVDQALLDEHSL